MNFLAHLYLSANHEEIMIGNFIGDFVRGRTMYEQYPYHIALGIELHREIDDFTDNHPVVLESKIRLRPKYRHYAPVIVDMFYDHFLAKYWSRFHTQPLNSFAQHAYQVLTKYEHQVPERVQQLVPYMIEGNWLLNYSRTEGIHRALSGMARRSPYNSKMNEAVEDLEKYHAEFEAEFSAFFPELKLMSDNFIRDHAKGIQV